MGPTTRQSGYPTPVVGIPLNPPVVRRTLEQAKLVLNDIDRGRFERRLTAFERTIGLESTVDNTNTAYKSMARLWSDTLIETLRLESEHRVISALLDCGDFIHDYIQPYSDRVSARLRINIETFHDRWISFGGTGNPNSFESRLVSETCRQVNPLMTQAELVQEEIKVQALMAIYSDRCRRCHNSVRNLNEQQYWDFLRDTEAKVLDDHYVFENPETAKLYIVRAIQTDVHVTTRGWVRNFNIAVMVLSFSHKYFTRQSL